MILQWRRRLLLGMGLSVGLALAVSPASASAAAVSTLTGESLSGISSSGNTSACPTATYSVSGDAGGPYAGTFSESGSWSIMGRTFTAKFTITSISGSKSLGGGSFNYLFCGETAGVDLRDSSYTATIHTPSGNFHDEGTSPDVGIFIFGTTGAAFLGENFTSSLTQPVLIAPTSKDECKNNGWKNFPQFKNQGQCVSFVVSQSQT
jgi:hypothetical protein